LTELGLEHEIYTIHDNPPDTYFDLGVCYAYTRKIEGSLLSKPKKGFVNYHRGQPQKYGEVQEISKGH